VRDPAEILEIAYKRAVENLERPIVEQKEVLDRILYISRLSNNRAGIRFILACSLAKIHRPEVDIRKPYTEIGSEDSYSGRHYDEAFVTAFVNAHDLPCNSTTAFLTPALRNIDYVLTTNVSIVGRPKRMYQELLHLLDDVYQKRISAEDLLGEVIRQLLILRDEQKRQIDQLLEGLQKEASDVALSAEGIVKLIENHLGFPNSSRLPVLIVAAAYNAAELYLREKVLPLESHNAADVQTGSIGDLQITLIDDNNVITSYEMKNRRITIDDIDRALRKIEGKNIENYIFITTEEIEKTVNDYALGIYNQMGIEIAILDCISFLRHYLHLFHRLRIKFLEEYQRLLLEEPESSVSHSLKQAFLAMRRAAESG